VKKWCGLTVLCEKSCEIKGGSQEMTAMMLMLINDCDIIAKINIIAAIS